MKLEYPVDSLVLTATKCDEVQAYMPGHPRKLYPKLN
jgi:hypothetical protein